MLVIESIEKHQDLLETNKNDVFVKFGPDMFLYSYNIVVKYGYAIAVDEDNQYKAVIRNQGSTYYHPYRYTGVLDMWFLDEYNCIILNYCNEYSVELCMAALKMWKGQRLILVGENWAELIPLLPDLPRIECFYEPYLTKERFLELTYRMKVLQLTFGIPHKETMERYENGVMTYDEVMALTFMFTDQWYLDKK